MNFPSTLDSTSISQFRTWARAINVFSSPHFLVVSMACRYSSNVPSSSVRKGSRLSSSYAKHKKKLKISFSSMKWSGISVTVLDSMFCVYTKYCIQRGHLSFKGTWKFSAFAAFPGIFWRILCIKVQEKHTMLLKWTGYPDTCLPKI